MSAYVAEEEQRTNWAGNLIYSAKNLVAPQSVEQAQETVRSADKIRVIGSRHCFNDIADTTGSHLSLENLNGVLLLDSAKRKVTVEGGIRYGELGPYLHEQGYALHNLASLPHISVAGACATATHGSGELGNLAVAVAEIEFIDGRGDLVTLSREKDADIFAGAVVNLGALGAVTKLTLDVQPAFHVRQDVFRELPLAALETHFEEIVSSGYSVSLFTTWQTDVIDLKPDWVSVMIGINDVWRQFDTPTITESHVRIEEYRETLDELVRTTLPKVKGMILMTPFYIEPSESDAMRSKMDQYGQVVKEIAEKHRTLFVDVQAAFEPVLEYIYPAALAWDRVHPNMTGHMTIARAFLKAVGYEWK